MAPESTIFQPASRAETQVFESSKSQVNVSTRAESGEIVNPISVGTLAFEASQVMASYTGIDLYGISQVTKAGNWVRNLFQKKAEREVVSGRGYQLKMPFWTKALSASVMASVLYFGGLGNAMNNVVEIIKDPTHTAQLLKDPEAQASTLGEVFRWFDNQNRSVKMRAPVLSSMCDDASLNGLGGDLNGVPQAYNFWDHFNLDISSSNPTESAAGGRLQSNIHVSYLGSESQTLEDGSLGKVYRYRIVDSRNELSDYWRETITNDATGDWETAMNQISKKIAAEIQNHFPNFQGLGDQLLNNPGGNAASLGYNAPGSDGTLTDMVKQTWEQATEANGGSDIDYQDMDAIMAKNTGTDICPDQQMNFYQIPQQFNNEHGTPQLDASVLPFFIPDFETASAEETTIFIIEALALV